MYNCFTVSINARVASSKACKCLLCDVTHVASLTYAQFCSVYIFRMRLTERKKAKKKQKGEKNQDKVWRSILWFFRDIYVFSFSKGSIYRRGARRWRKLYRVNGHIFQAKRFNRVSIISFNLNAPLLLSPSFLLAHCYVLFSTHRSRTHCTCDTSICNPDLTTMDRL